MAQDLLDHMLQIAAAVDVDMELPFHVAEALARQFNVSGAYIYAVKLERAREIEAMRDAIAEGHPDPTSKALWITDKTRRLFEYQEDITRLDKALAHPNELDPKLVRLKHAALRAVAEELGSLPTRPTAERDNSSVVHYIVKVDDSQALT